MKAYHFTGDKLRDGRPIPPIGEWLVHEGPLVICESGLHASRHPFDALRHAPGPYLHYVDVRGDIITQNDKLVGRERRILRSVDLTYTLRKFARMCALDVIHLCNAPDVVVQYLKTGDESLRDAARAAARVAWAASDAAWAAAWDPRTAWVAARVARAASAAARAAGDAAWVASDAAWTAWVAAWAASDAASAAGDAAWVASDAAWAAAKDVQRRRFYRLVRTTLKD